MYSKDPAFIFRQPEPPNGGPPPDLLRRAFVTPPDLFYIRSHGPTPRLDAAEYRLHIRGLVNHPTQYTLDQLRTGFPAHTVTATLVCAGNRREDLIALQPIPGEVPFGGEAISNAVWTGARLADVLAAAGLTAQAAHVEFIGLDQAEKDGKRYEFGGSIPREKALDPNTLLAYEMNGEPIPPVHGFPVRMVVPGYIGARSVKWLREINLLAEPSRNQFMAKQYRLFPRAATKESVDWSSGMSLSEVPTNSYICRVTSLPTGGTLAEGWAFTGGGRTVSRVEVSTDGGGHWTQAELLADDGGDSRWHWRFWRAELPQSAPEEIVVRALGQRRGHAARAPRTGVEL